MQRPFIRATAARERLRVATPWPEVFADLPVEFERPADRWRCQIKNAARQPAGRWVKPDPRRRRVEPRYTAADLRAGSICAAIERHLPLFGQPFIFDLPRYPSPLPGAPYIVVRPVTIRREWPATSRAPRPEYLQEAINALEAAGFLVVSVADVDGAAEWFSGPPPRVGVALHKGELDGEGLIGLVQHATACVGGVGWIVPMAIAAGVPLLAILGGRGAHNAPEVITDPRMDLTRATFAVPDRFCRCDKAEHDCGDKTIACFPELLAAWIMGLP